MIRDQFARTYDRWRSEPFPSQGHGEVLSVLHGNLALADTWVAEAVIPFVSRGVWKPVDPDVLLFLGDVIHRAGAAAKTSDTSEAQRAASYLRYARLLDEMYRAFLAEGPHGAPRASGPPKSADNGSDK